MCLLCLKADGVRSRGSKVCSTHTNRQDGGGCPGGACVCKGSNVLKVNPANCGLVSPKMNHIIGACNVFSSVIKYLWWCLCSTLKTIFGMCLYVLLLFSADIPWWQSGQWDTSGSSWSWSWSRSGCRTGSEAYHSSRWRTISKLRLSEKTLLFSASRWPPQKNI